MGSAERKVSAACRRPHLTPCPNDCETRDRGWPRMRCSVSISTTESAYGTGVSETFRLYVVDENKLPAPMPGASDDEKYSRLVKAVVEQGGLWGEVRLGVRLFAQVLELIDHEIGATGFLPVLAFNNSPHDILGADSSCPAFGYFNPEQIRDQI